MFHALIANFTGEMLAEMKRKVLTSERNDKSSKLTSSVECEKRCF